MHHGTAHEKQYGGSSKQSWNHHGTRQSHSCKYVCAPEGWKQGLEEVCIFNTIEEGTMWKPDSTAVLDDPQTSSKWYPNVASVVWKPGVDAFEAEVGAWRGAAGQGEGLELPLPMGPPWETGWWPQGHSLAWDRLQGHGHGHKSNLTLCPIQVGWVKRG
ncbi:unnamed protein product [Rangifer tarandus platyrhynchus]|uniref:Uncharacterized protein n=1 Tax=Rangifer tarandus platyrhynchus TaxID=3082113 RepID=A0AC59YK71_RANTA